MSEIKPKKERKFLKTLGRVGEILVEQVLLKLGSSIIRKIGGKKTLPSILFLFLSLSLFAQFPNTLNKQRLGFQTTADGLVWRGSISDTASIQPINNQNAWVILDTINLKFYTFDFTSNVWNLVGGAAFAQPVDSLFFNVNVPTNNVDTAKMRWDSDLATVVLGLNDNVPNELGFKNFWLVKNQTGSTITKGSLVYANGTVGASGRITVDKFIANGSIDAKYLLGITAHDLTDGEDGYVISFGKIRQVNTDTFAAGAILYPSPTVAGVWTDIEPVAPNIDMPIGFCINSSVNNGTIAIRVASGYKLSELHDVSITSPVDKASLYYSGGLWRDTTAALLVSDTASMLLPYFRDADTSLLNLTSRFAAKLNISDTSNMLVPYLRKADTTLMLSKYLRRADTSLLNLTSRFAAKLNISDTSNMLVPYLRKADTTNMLSPYFRDADTSLLNLTSRFNTKLNLSDTLNMLVPYLRKADTTNMLLPYFRDADTTSLNLTSRFNTKVNLSDTSNMLVPYLRKADTTLMLSKYLRRADTSLLNLTSRFAAKLNISDTASMLTPYLRKLDTISLSNRINTKLNLSDTLNMLVPYLRKADTTNMLLPYFRDADTTSLNLTSRFAAKLNISDTASMLTNYLRTGTAASTYLTQANAASTYLPLTGGTLTGALTGTTGTFTGLNINNTTTQGIFTLQGADNNTPTRIDFKTGNEIRRQIIVPTVESNMQFRTSTIGGTQGGYSFYTRRNPNAENLAFNIDVDGNSNFYGTLGVTGATTLSNNLSVNGTSTLNFTNIYGKSTYTPFNAGIGEQSISNVGVYLRGGTVMIFPDSNLVNSSANLFLANSNVLGVEYSAFGSGLRNYSKQGGDNRRNSLALYTSDIGQQNSNRLYINYNGDIGINDDTPSYTLDVNGTLNATGATTLSAPLTVNSSAVFNEGSADADFRVESDGNANMVFVDASTDRVGIGYASPTKTLDVNGEVRINTVTATPTSLLGKDGSNVVGTVTTVAQTGLMTRGETTATTGSPSATFTVTHGLGSTPTSVLVTSAGLAGAEKIIFEVFAKNSTTFSVQAWNYDGTEASSKSVKIFWLAIK